MNPAPPANVRTRFYLNGSSPTYNPPSLGHDENRRYAPVMETTGNWNM